MISPSVRPTDTDPIGDARCGKKVDKSKPPQIHGIDASAIFTAMYVILICRYSFSPSECPAAKKESRPPSPLFHRSVPRECGNRLKSNLILSLPRRGEMHCICFEMKTAPAAIDSDYARVLQHNFVQLENRHYKISTRSFIHYLSLNMLKKLQTFPCAHNEK